MGKSGLRFITMIAVLLAGLGFAAAFDVPDDQSCGGLVCDLGLFGHKIEPKPAVAPVAQAPVSPVSPVPVVTVDKTKTPEVPRTAHLAKTQVTRTRATKTQVTKAQATRAQVAKLTKPVAIPTPIVPKPAVAPPPPAAAPQNAGTVVLATPYVSTKPQPIQFQSVDPSAALW